MLDAADILHSTEQLIIDPHRQCPPLDICVVFVTLLEKWTKCHGPSIFLSDGSSQPQVRLILSHTASTLSHWHETRRLRPCLPEDEHDYVQKAERCHKTLKFLSSSRNTASSVFQALQDVLLRITNSPGPTTSSMQHIESYALNSGATGEVNQYLFSPDSRDAGHGKADMKDSDPSQDISGFSALRTRNVSETMISTLQQQQPSLSLPSQLPYEGVFNSDIVASPPSSPPRDLVHPESPSDEVLWDSPTSWESGQVLPVHRVGSGSPLNPLSPHIAAVALPFSGAVTTIPESVYTDDARLHRIPAEGLDIAFVDGELDEFSPPSLTFKEYPTALSEFGISNLEWHSFMDVRSYLYHNLPITYHIISTASFSSVG